MGGIIYGYYPLGSKWPKGAQSRSYVYVYALRPKVGIINVLGAVDRDQIGFSM